MYKYRTTLARITAAVIDYLVLVPIVLLDVFITFYEPGKTLTFTWLTISTAVQLGYSVWFHYNFGQTLGKAAMSIKVVDHVSENKITFKQAIIRDIVPLLVGFYCYIFYSYSIFTGTKHWMAENAIRENHLTIAGYDVLVLWAILELLSMFFTRKNRAFHNLLAGTVVVREEEKTAA
jgi:uncharacterized RDD family membrane protein YckC